MINHIPFDSLGKADHGWLKANHHFSFASYYNPKRMHFGALRVINDDKIAPHSGFAPHPHQNMEIITFVRTGAISHKDNQGNSGVTKAGEVQVMSAGSGIVHSEYNRTDEALTLFQIWIETNEQNVTPRWDSKEFSNYLSDTLPLLVSGDKNEQDKALFIYQDAKIYGGKLHQNTKVTLPIKHQAYVLASQGTFEVFDGQQTITLNKGDGAEITQSDSLTINTLTDSEVIVIDVPEL